MEANLILGASGTVGTRLLEEIVHQGLNARMRFACGSRSTATADKLQALGFETVFVDLNDYESVKKAVEGVTAIFLLKPYGIKMLNYAKSVVDAAASAGVRAIINLSAFGPDSSSIDLLAWHRLVDSYVERSGLSFTHVRPSFFMEGLAARIDPEARIVYDLSKAQKVPWVATADVARVVASIIGNTTMHSGKAFSLVSEIASGPEIADLMSELTGKEFTTAAMNEEGAVNGLVARGREPVFARAIIEYAKLAPTFSAQDATATIRAITGERATSIRDYLQNHPVTRRASTN